MYAEIILPLPLHTTFTYKVPLELENSIQVGCLVQVPFGTSKTHAGIVQQLHNKTIEKDFIIKNIIKLVYEEPLFSAKDLQLWAWIAQYYMCHLGEVYRAALPEGFNLQGKAGYKPKTEAYIKLCTQYANKETVHLAFNLTKRSKQQEALLLNYIQLSQLFEGEEAKEISKATLLKQSAATAASLGGLIKKGILQSYQKEQSRLNTYQQSTQEAKKLSAPQEQAHKEIEDSFKEKNVCLLHGVTSSGKTEIYIHLLLDTIKQGKQALLLLPEIALTTQLTQRLKQVFGDKMGVYHSQFNSNEKVEIWKNLKKEEGYQIIVGVRSAVFLPFQNLGLVIVDEEHETSYKQQDPAPRYHARNTAIVLAKLHQANVLLGSATPSIESYFNALRGKYGLVELNTRFQDVLLPQIEIVNTKELKRKKRMKGILSPPLLEKMNTALQAGEQVILFQNRRGFAPIFSCSACGWVPKCTDCDVSLTYHKQKQVLNCHYCGKNYSLPSACPSCGGVEFNHIGIGTEKIEEEVQTLFPNYQVQRLDFDNTRSKGAYAEIISAFESGKTHILIGTQMLSKGLDFDRVSVVGIVHADQMMNLPDFRAHERAYQLMAQVSGRAGRRNKQGSVVLQTADSEHVLLQSVADNQYKEMLYAQLEERKLFRYPPYYRLIEINFKYKQESMVSKLAELFAQKLKKEFGSCVLGSDTPIIRRIQAQHLRRIILKVELGSSMIGIQEKIWNIQTQLTTNTPYRYISIAYNVDPL